ncbi:MAG: hypothetical protein P8X79_13500, partial [Reinekea sp.]
MTLCFTHTRKKSLALAMSFLAGLTTTALADNNSRQTHYDHNKFGQITSVDGPRTDVQDITTYDY